MSSKMEQIIEEIEEYIDGCKFQPLSSTKIIVNKEELEELIADNLLITLYFFRCFGAKFRNKFF